MKKFNKRLLALSIAFSVTAVGSMFFKTINADTIEYDVWINGERFTSENRVIQCGEGTATINGDVSSGITIILENAQITESYEYQPYYEAAIYSGAPNLTLQIIGDNSIIPTSQYADGIDAAGGSYVVIAGSEDDKLDIKNTYYGTYIGSYDVEGGDLTITGGVNVNIENTSAAGIWVNRNIDLANCTVTINREASYYNGMVSNIDGTISFQDANLTINNVQAAIHMGNTDNSIHKLVMLSGNVVLNSSEAYGIKVEPDGETGNINGEITIEGGTLQISSALGGTNVPLEKIHFANGIGYTSELDFIQPGVVTIGEVEIEFIKGDMNNDTFINSTDAAVVLDKFKNNNATTDDFARGDMDNNNILNATDAAMILDIFKNS